MNRLAELEQIKGQNINDDINSGFNVYPNPSKGIFTVENSHSESVAFIVRNVLGQISFKGNLNAISNSTFDLSHLESGIYTIEFDGQAKKHNQKLVIEKQTNKYNFLKRVQF